MKSLQHNLNIYQSSAAPVSDSGDYTTQVLKNLTEIFESYFQYTLSMDGTCVTSSTASQHKRKHIMSAQFLQGAPPQLTLDSHGTYAAQAECEKLHIERESENLNTLLSCDFIGELSGENLPCSCVLQVSSFTMRLNDIRCVFFL